MARSRFKQSLFNMGWEPGTTGAKADAPKPTINANGPAGEPSSMELQCKECNKKYHFTHKLEGSLTCDCGQPLVTKTTNGITIHGGSLSTLGNLTITA